MAKKRPRKRRKRKMTRKDYLAERKREARERAAKSVTVTGAKEIAALIYKIARLLQLSDPGLEAWPCGGRHRGVSNYKLGYHNVDINSGIYIDSIENPLNKTRRTESLIRILDKTLRKAEAVFGNKTAIRNALKERERKDNARAAEMGLKPYRLKRIGIHPDFGNIYPYVVIEIDGREWLHSAGGIGAKILDCDIEALRSVSPEYRPHGGAEAGSANDRSDFIYGGVGFRSGETGFFGRGEKFTVIAEQESPETEKGTETEDGADSGRNRTGGARTDETEERGQAPAKTDPQGLFEKERGMGMNTIETMAAMRAPPGESPKGTHYALTRLGESARAARHAATEMPRLRERARKHGDAGGRSPASTLRPGTAGNSGPRSKASPARPSACWTKATAASGRQPMRESSAG